MHKYQLCNNDSVKQRKYLRLIFEENFEVDVGAEDGVSCHPLQKHLMHRNRLLKRRQVFAETCHKGKGKINHAPPQASTVGAHLPLLGLEPVGGEPLMSVTRGQCNARPTVTFPATRHHRTLAGTKLYCLVTEAHVC